MVKINPYLNFPGNTEEAFNFYRSVFGGSFSAIQRFKETPEAGRVPNGEKDKLMHIALPVGSGNTLMATDALDSMGHTLKVGNNIQLSIEAETKDEATEVFTALAEGGKVTMPLTDTFWGQYFGMLTDRFGIHWMVGHTNNRKNT